MQSSGLLRIVGQVGECGHHRVFLGYAKACDLFTCSFPDVLDEDTGLGYQRPVNRSHSRNFKNYICQPNTSTIPLTFNLRPNLASLWRIRGAGNGLSYLELSQDQPALSRVDCQHRISEMSDVEITFAFMAFIGLDIQTEMALFNIINSKAKGLCSSLTDYHESRLLQDIEKDAPHLLIARRLNEDPESPWFRMVRYGGENTSGTLRRTSFRMLQVSVKRTIQPLNAAGIDNLEDQYELHLIFWRTVSRVFKSDWDNHRKTLITKGIGLYSLTLLFCEFLMTLPPNQLTEKGFYNHLCRLVGVVSWDSKGEFANAGGKKGATQVFIRLKEIAL